MAAASKWKVKSASALPSDSISPPLRGIADPSCRTGLIALTHRYYSIPFFTIFLPRASVILPHLYFALVTLRTKCWPRQRSGGLYEFCHRRRPRGCGGDLSGLHHFASGKILRRRP